MSDATPGDAAPSDAVVRRLDPPVRGIGPLSQVAIAIAFVAAVVGTATRGTLSRTAGGIAVITIVAAPLLRVVLLTGTWWHRRDRRYALVGVGLLAVVGAGAVLALLR